LGVERSIQERGFLAMETLPHDLRPYLRAASEFSNLFKEVDMGVKKKESLGAKSST